MPQDIWEFNKEPHRSIYMELHTGDEGKFKVGTTVIYIGNSFPVYTGKEFKILASNVQDAESTEYLMKGFPYLVYEEEIQEKL